MPPASAGSDAPRNPISASFSTIARSMVSVRSHSRACGTTSRSRNSRAVARISSCSAVSVKSTPGTNGARPTPGPVLSVLSSLEEVARFAPGTVVVTDDLHLVEREVVVLGRLADDALDHVRVRPVHLLGRRHERRARRVLPGRVEQLDD